MTRNSNDNRSDSMNPNNPAYHASEANRSEQLDLSNGEDEYSCIDDHSPYPFNHGYLQSDRVNKVQKRRIVLTPCPDHANVNFLNQFHFISGTRAEFTRPKNESKASDKNH